MSTAIIPTLLDAARFINDTGTGITARRITHIALGDVGYVPSAKQTALRRELARYPISGGRRISDTQLHVTALADDGSEFYVREVGFVLDNGALLAIWSDPEHSLCYKSALHELLLVFDLDISALPAGSVTIEAPSHNLNLSIAPELAQLAAANLSSMLRDMQQDDRLLQIERRTAKLSESVSRHDDELAAAARRDAALAAGLADLGKVSAWQSEAQAELLRGAGQSGLYMMRGYASGGPMPYDRPYIESFNAAGIHNHANYDGMPGTAEFSAIVNGYYLRTRHNDYRLRAPAPVGSAWLATVPVDAPPLPASVANAGSLAAQTAAMRQLFADYQAGKWPAGFGWTLSYLEFWFEPLTSQTADTFDSFRHQQRVTDIDQAFREAMRYNAGGFKDRFENIAYEPPVVRWIHDGKPVLARMRYRMAAVDVSHLGDLRPSLQSVDDPAMRAGFGRESGRYRIPEADNAPGMLDKLMSAIPGLDGSGALLRETYREYGLDNVLNGWDNQPLNAAYYSRYCRRVSLDAANRDHFHRGFNDPTLFAAINTRPQVLPLVMDGQQYRFSYALPFELVLRTPLERWNPHNVPEVSALTGTGGEAAPYNGFRRDAAYYRVPAEFFGKTFTLTDAADTGGAAAWMRCGDGQARQLRGGGIYVSLPEIPGIGSIRCRFPIFPVHQEGGHAYAQLQAVRREQAEVTAALAASALQLQHKDLSTKTAIDELNAELEDLRQQLNRPAPPVPQPEPPLEAITTIAAGLLEMQCREIQQL